MKTLESQSYLTNEQLVEIYQKTLDDDVLANLFKRFRPMIIHLSTKYDIPYLDYQDIEQEMNIAFVKAIKNYKIEVKAYFASFARSVCYNHLVNLIRHSQAYNRNAGKVEESIYRPLNDEDFNLLSVLADRRYLSVPDIINVREKYSDFLSSLSNLEKRILGKYLISHDYKQIASELGISLKKVNDTLYRCRKKLKQSLK